MTPTWTTANDIARRVRRLWEDGSLLRAHAINERLVPIEIPISGPKSSEIGDDLAAVRAWVAALDAGRRDGRRYDIQWRTVGGRKFGRNELPARALVSSLSQAWALLDCDDSVRQFDDVLSVVDGYPPVRQWVVDHPLRALQLIEVMPGLVAAYRWLDAHRDSNLYLRQISAPGVDTKFAERHRAVLAEMLGVPSSGPSFLAGLGLQTKPELVRIRLAPSLGLPPALSEMAVRASDLADLEVRPQTAVVIENEITYLSVDVPTNGVVLWGKGFEVDRVGRLPWLADTDVIYWGDIDTHGFAILDRLRAWLPHARSVLMDRDTLLAHRDRWVREDRPATSSLTRLTQEEAHLYASLIDDSLGEQVRLEQERIDWQWAQERL